MPHFDRLRRYGLTFSLALPLIAHAWMGAYSRFTADTYCHAVLVQAHGLGGMIVTQYLVWSGRYTSSLVEGIEAGLVGPGGQPFWPALIIGAWLAAVWALLIGLLPGRRWLACTLAVGVVSATVMSLPNVTDALYWSTGMFNYIPPLVLGTALAAMVVARMRRPASPAAVWFVSALALMLLAGGFNETATVVGIMALLAGLLLGPRLLARPHLRAALPVIVGGLLGAVAALLIVALAPGNQVRQSYLVSTHAPVALALLTTRTTADSLILIMRGAPLPLLFAFSLPALLAPAPSSLPVASVRRWLLLISGLAFGGLWFASLPTAYAVSEMPNGRTLATHTYLLVIALAASGWLAGPLAVLPAVLRPRLALGLVALWAAAVAYQTVGVGPELARFAAAWDDMHATLLDARAHGAAQVQVSVPPVIALGQTTSASPWVVACMSDYYAVDVIAP